MSTFFCQLFFAMDLEPEINHSFSDACKALQGGLNSGEVHFILNNKKPLLEARRRGLRRFANERLFF